MKNSLIFGVFFILIISFTECKDKESGQGNLQINFKHLIDNKEIVYDSMIYINAAGNPYSVTEVKWFISRVILFIEGEKIEITDNDGIHFIETNITGTLTWAIEQKFEEGEYDSLQFVFGFNASDNTSNRFVNPPETSMAWPLTLGGGYHYMMLNGRYKSSEDKICAMNAHLGIGQIYEGTTYSVDSIINFVNNNFTVTLRQPFTVEKDQTSSVSIIMNIENWFRNPINYDHNQWGSHIMQKQEAMHILIQNGWNVFSMKVD